MGKTNWVFFRKGSKRKILYNIKVTKLSYHIACYQTVAFIIYSVPVTKLSATKMNIPKIST